MSKSLRVVVRTFIVLTASLVFFFIAVYLGALTFDNIQVEHETPVVQNNEIIVPIKVNRSLRTIIDPEISSYISCVSDKNKYKMYKKNYIPTYDEEHWTYSFMATRKKVDEPNPVDGKYHYHINLRNIYLKKYLDTNIPLPAEQTLYCRVFVPTVLWKLSVSNLFVLKNVYFNQTKPNQP